MRNTQRLDRILSNCGCGTRKEIKQVVKEGRVKVDGEVVKDSGIHLNPESSTIEIDEKVLNYSKYLYVMMNKPDGVLSATFDSRQKTVADILPENLKGFDLFPVGRLDIDTEGLLLMMNDGQLAHELLSPKKHVPKKYYALVEGLVTERDVERFREGVELEDGYKTLPAELKVIKAEEHSEIEVVIYEGKFHQVKRMFEAVGKRVTYLRRIEMGMLVLDEALKSGECRLLTEDEIDGLKQSVSAGKHS